MKLHKKLIGLAACVVGCASILSLASCSVFVDLLDSTNGADSVSGTYSFDISIYDSNYTDYILYGNDAVQTYFVPKGVTQTITLELGSDGSYTYTKEIYFATEGDSWYTYSLVKFMGEYENTGSTVTLGEVTKLAYAFEPAPIRQANTSIPTYEYTETDDVSTSTYVISGLASIMDYWWGPYFSAIEKGNVAQTVYIGNYDWGGFTYADDGKSSIINGASSSTTTEDEITNEYFYVSSSNFGLYIYTDYTFDFQYSTYGISEKGTWIYEESTLTLTYGSYNWTSTVEDDEVSLYYAYSVYTSVNATFKFSLTEFEDWYNTYVLSASDTGGNE